MYTIERIDYDNIQWYWTGTTWSVEPHHYADLDRAKTDTASLIRNGMHYGDHLVINDDQGNTLVNY